VSATAAVQYRGDAGGGRGECRSLGPPAIEGSGRYPGQAQAFGPEELVSGNGVTMEGIPVRAAKCEAPAPP